MDEIRFDERVVLVTGAGRGLGAAYARLFGERGAIVVAHDAGVDRNGRSADPALAHAVAEEIRVAGGYAVAEVHDLSERDACEALVGRVLERFGRLDALVHSAGLVAHGGIEEVTLERWRALTNVNVEAPFWLCRAAWPSMRRQRYGRIVLTVSGYGLRHYEGSDVTAYGMGKAAQFGLMNGLAGEGQPHGILANAVSPVAATRMFSGRVRPGELSPESVAPGVAFLASSACRWTGQVLAAAGGKFSLGRYEASAERELGPDPTIEAVALAFADGE